MSSPMPPGPPVPRGQAVLDAARAALERLRHDRYQQVAVWIGLALVVAGVAGFISVLDAVRERDDLAALDTPVLEGLATARSDVLTALLTAVTTVAGPTVLPVLVAAGAGVWAWRTRLWWPPLLLVGSMVTATLVSVGIKGVVARPRPPVDLQVVAGFESTYSFPSGHTIGTATLLLVVGYLVWVRRPRWASLLVWLVGIVLGVALVALSRLYLGYHFVTDVAASVSLAVAILGGVVVLDRRRAVRAARVTAALASRATTPTPPPTP